MSVRRASEDSKYTHRKVSMSVRHQRSTPALGTEKWHCFRNPRAPPKTRNYLRPLCSPATFFISLKFKKKKESAQLEKEARVRKNLKQWLCLDAEINWPSPRLTYQIDVYPGGSNVLLFTCGLQRCITCVRERPRPLSCKLSKSVSNASFTRRYFKLRTELSVSCTAGACLSPPLQRIRSRHDTVSRGDVH